MAHHVQILVKSERNRQIMCESGLLETLLTHYREILCNTTHSLHLPVLRILEKLASQSIDHKSLRLVASIYNMEMICVGFCHYVLELDLIKWKSSCVSLYLTDLSAHLLGNLLFSGKHTAGLGSVILSQGWK